MPIEWVVPAVALLLLIWFWSVHRRLKALRGEATQLWSELEARLQRRHDLVPVLVDTVGQAVKPKALQAVSDARKLAALAQTPERIGKAEAALAAAIGQVLEMAEADPGLRANAGFRRLRTELAELEAEIVEGRSLFNETVEDYSKIKGGLGGTLVSSCIQVEALEPYFVPGADEPAVARR